MKQIFTCLILSGFFMAKSQTNIAGFEDFNLSTASYYKDTTDKPFKTAEAEFTYDWTGGQYPYWSGGFSYTNRYDSATAGFTNLYGVKAYKGNNGSDTYVIGQDKGIIRLRYAQTTVNGFYCTNTTYAFKSVKNGDAFSRKFGDTTGTGAGTTIPQGSYPDYFKLTVKAYSGGFLKNDSVEFYLADYRFTDNSKDFVVSDWRFINTSSLGTLDSLQFGLRSSDNSAWGMNTPGFFAIDDFSSSNGLFSGIDEKDVNTVNVFPVPAKDCLNVVREGIFSCELKDLNGKIVLKGNGNNALVLDLSAIAKGVYALTVTDVNASCVTKILKE